MQFKHKLIQQELLNDWFFYCISETKKTISNDEGEIDNEPVAKKSKYELGLEEHPLDSDDEPLSKLTKSTNVETSGCEDFIPQQQRQIDQLSPSPKNTTICACWTDNFNRYMYTKWHW